MSEEEILNMKMLIGHLDLTTDTKNKLYNQTTKIENILNKQKEILNRLKCVYTSMQFSAPENMYTFIEQMGDLLEEIE